MFCLPKRPRIISRRFIFTESGDSFLEKTKKFAYEEEEYIKILYSTGELYDDNSIDKNNEERCDLSFIFKHLNALACSCSCSLNEVSIHKIRQILIHFTKLIRIVKSTSA